MPIGAGPPTDFQPPPFEHVYQQTVKLVHRYARLKGLSTSLADDFAQEVFLTVYQWLPQFEGRCKLSSWVMIIARRRLGKFLASSRHRPSGQQPLPEDDFLPAAKLERDPLERKLALRLLQDAVEQMDSRLSDVYLLCEVEGFTAPEASRILDVPANTIRDRRRKAKNVFEVYIERRRPSDGE